MSGLSNQVRRVAEREYVLPALSNKKAICIRIGDIEKTLLREGFPARHINQICSALESQKFWGERLELRGPRVKPRRVDTVYEFSLKDCVRGVSTKQTGDPLLDLVGVLKGAICEGADAFVREMRSDKNEVNGQMHGKANAI